MVNSVLDSRWAEAVQQLALGIEPVDALRGVRIGQRLNITLEAPPPGLRALRLTRHDSGLFALLHGNGDAADLVVRIFDAAFELDSGVYDPERSRRRFVPRRLGITVPAADQAEALELTRRARRPGLFAGAAYDATAATGLRGRVQRGGLPVRWARIEARLAGSPLTVGRAHGDDRGEFLLLLDAAAAPMSVLETPLSVELHVWLPLPPMPLPNADQQAADALWDLPIETLSPTGALPDAVADGSFPPAAGWAEAAAPFVLNDLPYGVVRDGLVVLNV